VFLEPAADTHEFDADGEALGIGFDENRAEGRRAGGGAPPTISA